MISMYPFDQSLCVCAERSKTLLALFVNALLLHQACAMLQEKNNNLVGVHVHSQTTCAENENEFVDGRVRGGSIATAVAAPPEFEDPDDDFPGAADLWHTVLIGTNTRCSKCDWPLLYGGLRMRSPNGRIEDVCRRCARERGKIMQAEITRLRAEAAQREAERNMPSFKRGRQTEENDDDNERMYEPGMPSTATPGEFTRPVPNTPRWARERGGTHARLPDGSWPTTPMVRTEDHGVHNRQHFCVQCVDRNFQILSVTRCVTCGAELCARCWGTHTPCDGSVPRWAWCRASLGPRWHH
jgi:hypothetical protein